MEDFRKHKTTVTPQQMKFQLRHKLASLLTEQKLKEKAERELADQNRSTIIDENKDGVLPTLHE